MSQLPIPHNLSRWLTDPTSQVGYYYGKAQRLLILNHRWKQQKDTPLVFHSTIANWEDTTLVIAVDHSEWATHLYYAKFELLARLKSWPELGQLTNIRWHVQSPTYQALKKAPPTSMLTLSQKNRELLHSVIGTLSHYPLQVALRQLTRY